jgi:hypothetical protein
MRFTIHYLAILCLVALPITTLGQDSRPATTPPAATPQPEVVVIQGERPAPQQTPAPDKSAETAPVAPVAPVPTPDAAAPGEVLRPERGSTESTPPTPPASAFSGDFTIVSDPDNLMLRLTPERQPDSQDLTVIQGETFVTDVVLSNRRRTPVNGLRVVIDYNPAYVNPVKLNDGLIANRVSGRPRMSVNRDRGQIVYEAILFEPIIDPEDALMFIEWKALQPVLFTPIVFGRDREGRSTELYDNTQGVLGEVWQDGDGTLSIGVMIVPSDPAEAELMQQEPMLYTGSSERIGGVRLELVPPKDPPRVGEVFPIDIVLDNRVYSMIDGLTLIIEYDSEVLEIFDHDLDNWVTLGNNIHDGSFRSAFPWDYHMANEFQPGRGLIEYRVGTSMPDDFQGAYGTMAQIFVRGKKPTTGTPLRFLFSRTPGRRSTEVVYLGQDVLGEPDIRNDGVRATVITIRP